MRRIVGRELTARHTAAAPGWLFKPSQSFAPLKKQFCHSRVKIIWLSPSGKQFTNESGTKLAKHSNIIIICGRYEGIDARVKKAFRVEEISVGPFVLTGGELPAMIMIDVISRQVEGVLGDFNSREESRIASPDVYTRPEVFDYKGKKLRVPKVLLSGHQANIEAWKQSKKKR